jgi:hypothetical protein
MATRRCAAQRPVHARAARGGRQIGITRLLFSSIFRQATERTTIGSCARPASDWPGLSVMNRETALNSGGNLS